MNFVSAYRNMTLIPKPEFTLLPLKDLFKRVEGLMNNKIINSGISFKWAVDPESLELTADRGLMEQVMINLLLNGIDAVTGRENPAIILSGYMDAEGRINITVEDNGAGIVNEAMDRIFIPFFTTKKNGSPLSDSSNLGIIITGHYRYLLKVENINHVIRAKIFFG